MKYPGLQASQALKLFTLFFTDDVDMMVFWRIPDQNVSGFHHIGGINLGLQSPLQLQSYLGAKIREVTLKGGRTLLDGGRALFASTAREQKALVNSLLSSNSKDSSPVRVIMDYQEDVCHDFDQGYVFIPSNLSATYPYRMFILPIRVGICNSSRMNAVHVRFELILPSR